MVEVLKALRDLGNTVIVVEHEEEIMRAADQIIDIGPMSGKSNVIFWLERRGITASEELVDRIFQRAKASDRCLTEEEILACCQKVSAGT
jgi:excinuclease UvrABC ATPase subunit